MPPAIARYARGARTLRRPISSTSPAGTAIAATQRHRRAIEARAEIRAR